MHSFSIQWIRKFLRGTFPLSLAISISVYAWVRLIFYEVPFSFREDATIICKVIVTGWSMVIFVKATFYLLLGIGQLFRQRSLRPLLTHKWIAVFITVLFLSALLVACRS
jgi:hypothetical protein